MHCSSASLHSRSAEKQPKVTTIVDLGECGRIEVMFSQHLSWRVSDMNMASNVITRIQ
jgi:hypothetical protein